MKLYYCRANHGFDYRRAEALIDPLRLARTRRLPSDKQPVSLVGGLLLRYALLLEQVPYHSLMLLPSGKPCLSWEGKHISLSHSGDHAICGLGDEPLGVDIQIISLPRDRLIHRVCSPAEQVYIREAPCPATAFTCLWVLKESYVKLLGCGIGTDLRAISFSIDGEHVRGPEGYTFELSFEIEGAVIGVCTQNPPQNK